MRTQEDLHLFKSTDSDKSERMEEENERGAFSFPFTLFLIMFRLSGLMMANNNGVTIENKYPLFNQGESPLKRKKKVIFSKKKKF